MMRLMLFLLCLVLPTGVKAQDVYDPLTQKFGFDIEELSIPYPEGDRIIPVLAYIPRSEEALPVVLFSHGLGGSRYGSSYLGRHWASRGYAAIFVQHPGSDESVWKDAGLLQRRSAMNKAASTENFLHRVRDIPQVLDTLKKWNVQSDNPVFQKLNMDLIGMSGHSFGAVTTQALSGQKANFGRGFTDNRIKAAIAFSPSPARRGDTQSAFADVFIPWMLMTGTKDGAPIGGMTPEKRLDVYPALPPGDKYELVLKEAEHSAFTERSLRGEQGQRNPNHHKAILALSTAFWDAYLKGDQNALEWLKASGPSSVLEAGDRWQYK